MKLAIIGVGLIGGSIGLAARRRTDAEVVGYDPDGAALERAVASGAIHEYKLNLDDAVHGADAVFVATPVGALFETVKRALDVAGPRCMVTDVGSTKQYVVGSVSDKRFIGGHPLAGAETSGVQNARADLFDKATWYLTPRPDVREQPERRLRDLIRQLGAEPMSIDANTHDEFMARVSHLPHVLANLLVDETIAAAGNDRALRDKLRIGPSFRDATRVAGANTSIWTDIYLSNSKALAGAVNEMVRKLTDIAQLLNRQDTEALRRWNDEVRAHHERLRRVDVVPDE